MKIRLIAAAAAALVLSLSGCVIDAAALNGAAWYQPAPTYRYYQPAPSYGYLPSLSYGNVYYGGVPRHGHHHHR